MFQKFSFIDVCSEKQNLLSYSTFRLRVFLELFVSENNQEKLTESVFRCRLTITVTETLVTLLSVLILLKWKHFEQREFRLHQGERRLPKHQTVQMKLFRIFVLHASDWEIGLKFVGHSGIVPW